MFASRSKLLSPIRAKFALTLNGRVRPPSPLPSPRLVRPLPSQRPVRPPPSPDSGFDRVIISSDSFSLTPDDILCEPESIEYGHSYCFVDPYKPSAILSAVEDVIASARRVIKCKKYSAGIFSKCLEVISTDSIFENCSIDTKLEVMSTIFHQFRCSPMADPIEVFLMEIYLRSMSTDDSKNYIWKHEVSSRVLGVIQRYPNVGRHFKVTEETSLGEDLGFVDFDFDRVRKALYLEFKQFIESSEVSDHSTCEEIIDHIYLFRSQSIIFEEFRERNIVGDLFFPMPLNEKKVKPYYYRAI